MIPSSDGASGSTSNRCPFIQCDSHCELLLASCGHATEIRFDASDAVRTLIAVERAPAACQALLLFDCGTELRDSASVFVKLGDESMGDSISSVFACALFW